ncbi:hypothetical protein Tco_1440317 [Tanacetum coccineum]
MNGRGRIVYNWICGQIARLGPKARVIMWPKPRGLVHPVYVIKSPQSSMILPADHVLRAVINARLSATLFPPGVIYFYAVPLLVSLFTGRRVGEGSALHLVDHVLRAVINARLSATLFPPGVIYFYAVPLLVHPTAPGRDVTITQFPEGKVGVYTRLFDYCGYRIPLTKFFVAVLKHFRIHISQLSPFGAARVSHFEVLTRVLNLAPSVAVFRAFYTRIYSDGLFSFAKRSLSAPSCLSKPPDSIKNWADHFFWVDSKVFPISVPLYTGGALEKDPAPHLTARQEQTVQVLSANKAPFRRYPECFLVLVGLSLYYPFDENTYPAFERPDKTDMGLLDYIRTADPRKVQAVEVQKGEEQVKLLDSIKHCFVSLDAPAVVQQEGCSGSGAGPDVSAPSAEENVVAEENVIPAGTYLDLMDPEGNLTEAEKGGAARKQPDKVKRKKLSKQSDTLPAKKLRVDHPSLASGTGGKSLASLRRTIPEGSLALGPSFSAGLSRCFVLTP